MTTLIKQIKNKIKRGNTDDIDQKVELSFKKDKICDVNFFKILISCNQWHIEPERCGHNNTVRKLNGVLLSNMNCKIFNIRRNINDGAIRNELFDFQNVIWI